MYNRSGLHDLDIIAHEQKDLQRKFSDDRLRYGRNRKTGELQAWYVPGSSPPYCVAHAVSWSHAVRQIAHKAKFDRMRATDMIRKIDEQNKKYQENERKNAMLEIKSGLKAVASGRKMFLT